MNKIEVDVIVSNDESAFSDAINGLYDSHRKPDRLSLLGVGSLRAGERNSPGQLSTLDALSGVVEAELENWEEAEKLWSGVIRSPHARNADKIIAHAGMARVSLHSKNFGMFKMAIDEINTLSLDYDAHLWVADALKRLLLACEGTRMDNGYIYVIYRIAAEACEALEKSKSVKTRVEASELHTEILLSYGTLLSRM